MNAAGRTLTKSELLDAFAALADNDPITVTGAPVTRANPDGDLEAEVQLWEDDPNAKDADEMRDLLVDITTQQWTKDEILDRVKEYLE